MFNELMTQDTSIERDNCVPFRRDGRHHDVAILGTYRLKNRRFGQLGINLSVRKRLCHVRNNALHSRVHVAPA